MRDAPKLLDRLAPEDAEHFAQVRALLDDAGIHYELDPTLVRGLDYYTRTLFEFSSDALGAQSGVGGGGRYDRLIEQLGGPPTPASGWAAGVERMLLAAGEQPVQCELVDLFIALPGHDGVRAAFRLAREARQAGLRAQLELAGRSLRGQLRHADRIGARYVAIIGERGDVVEEHGVRRAAGHAPARRDPDDPAGAPAVNRAPRPNRYRDAWSGELTAERAGTQARVAGWVHRRRDHGGLIFIDLRDRSGHRAARVPPRDRPGGSPGGARAALRGRAVGVRRRSSGASPENVNPNIATGEIELSVEQLEILADAETPPFPIDEDVPVEETLRLRHRSLDLRRAPMLEALTLRHRAIATIREVLDDRDFLEIETPFLTRSTPEGARDFLVPARTQPGSFYALPQSPQLFKQLLMIGGMERYYQIVRCFRDEDARADRLPEFTQLDVEMSFVDEDDVIEVSEAAMGAVFEREGFDVPAPPWPRMTFAEAVSRFGSDRPDTRFGLELKDLGGAVANSGFQVFARALKSGGVVRGINAGARELSRADLDGLTELAKQHGAKGLVWAFVEAGGLALADRQVPVRAGDRRHRAAAGGLRRRPAADRRRRATHRRPGAGRAAARARTPLRPDPRGPPRHPLGGRVPDVHVAARRAALGRRAPSVHRPVRRPRRSRRACCRAPTTSSSTATSSAAGRSVTTAARSRRRSSS